MLLLKYIVSLTPTQNLQHADIKILKDLSKTSIHIARYYVDSVCTSVRLNSSIKKNHNSDTSEPVIY